MRQSQGFGELYGLTSELFFEGAGGVVGVVGWWYIDINLFIYKQCESAGLTNLLNPQSMFKFRKNNFYAPMKIFF